MTKDQKMKSDIIKYLMSTSKWAESHPLYDSYEERYNLQIVDPPAIIEERRKLRQPPEEKPKRKRKRIKEDV